MMPVSPPTPDVKTAHRTAAQPVDWMFVGDTGDGNQERVDIFSDGTMRYANGQIYEAPKPKP